MEEVREAGCEEWPEKGEPLPRIDDPKDEVEFICSLWYLGPDALLFVWPDGRSKVVPNIAHDVSAERVFSEDGSQRVMFRLPRPSLLPPGGLEVVAEVLRGLKRAAVGLLDARSVSELAQYCREAWENLSRIYCKRPCWSFLSVLYGEDSKARELIFRKLTFSSDSPIPWGRGCAEELMWHKDALKLSASALLEAWKEGKWVYVTIGLDGADAAVAVRRKKIPYVSTGYANKGCFYFLLPPPPVHASREVVKMVLEELKTIALELLSFNYSGEGRGLSLDCVERAAELIRGAAMILRCIYRSHPYKTNILFELNKSGMLSGVLTELLMHVR